MKKLIGISPRTKGKHDLLNKVLGREVGVAPHLGWLKKMVILDLCAGDGRPSEMSDKSSPEIISKHAKYLEMKGFPFSVQLYEKNKNTYDILVRDYPHAINKDSQEIIDLNDIVEQPNVTACFLHIDPNHVQNWPLNPVLLKNLPSCTTMLVTLGCNVGGMKRCKLDERKSWAARIFETLYFIPSHHDALLVVLRNDPAQWAYLLTGPRKWEDAYRKDAYKAFKNCWPNGLDVFSLRRETLNFEGAITKLFMTKSEII